MACSQRASRCVCCAAFSCFAFFSASRSFCNTSRRCTRACKSCSASSGDCDGGGPGYSSLNWPAGGGVCLFCLWLCFLFFLYIAAVAAFASNSAPIATNHVVFLMTPMRDHLRRERGTLKPVFFYLVPQGALAETQQARGGGLIVGRARQRLLYQAPFEGVDLRPQQQRLAHVRRGHGCYDTGRELLR